MKRREAQKSYIKCRNLYLNSLWNIFTLTFTGGERGETKHRREKYVQIVGYLFHLHCFIYFYWNCWTALKSRSIEKCKKNSKSFLNSTIGRGLKQSGENGSKREIWFKSLWKFWSLRMTSSIDFLSLSQDFSRCKILQHFPALFIPRHCAKIKLFTTFFPHKSLSSSYNLCKYSSICGLMFFCSSLARRSRDKHNKNL